MIIKRLYAVLIVIAASVGASLCFAPPSSHSENSGFSFDNRLVDAVEQNNYNIVNALVKSGEDVNKTGKFHTSALQRAAYNGNMDLINLLITNGADVNNLDFGGASALHIAARQGRELVARTLMQRGAEIDISDELGYTPLHRAVSNRQLGVTQLLIRAGANVNTVNNEGNSPLIDAVRTSNLAIVKELLVNGADKTIRNNKGQDVIDYAMKLRNPEIDAEMASNYDNLIARNEAMRKNAFANTTPEFMRHEAAKNYEESDVMKVEVARVEVEELKAAPRVNADGTSAVVQPDLNAGKSWIRASGAPELVASRQLNENIMPRNLSITDSGSLTRMNDIENTHSINFGRMEAARAPAPVIPVQQNNMPASIAFKNVMPAQVAAPQNNGAAYESEVDMLLNDYAQTIQVDTDYMSEVDSLMNQLTGAEPAPSHPLTSQVKAPAPYQTYTARQGLAAPASQLQRTPAAIPFQNERGDFMVEAPTQVQSYAAPVQPVKIEPAPKPQTELPALPRPVVITAPKEPAPVVAAVKKAEPQKPGSINYDSYRSNLLQNVDEFYNNPRPDNYGKLDISEIEKKRAKNLNMEKTPETGTSLIDMDIPSE